MNVTIQPAAVNAIGNAAKDVGQNVLNHIPGYLKDGQADVGNAHIEGLATKGSLDTMLSNWVTIGTDASTRTVSVGDKFVTSASVYVNTDHQSAGELFTVVPPYRGEKGDR